MAKRRRIRYRRPNHPVKKSRSTFILLDQFSAGDIQKWKAFTDKYLKCHWDYYKELAYQRSKIADQIKESLLEASQKSFSLKNWQRAVKYKYALEPFSTAGSLTDPGGRFNIGEINPTQFPPFPTLYLAADKDTALQELLSQKNASEHKSAELTPLDFALTRPDSISVVSVSGLLGSIINLKKPDMLQPFVDLIKKFSIPDYLKKAAKDIGEQEPELIKTVPKLIDAIQHPDWRLWPMQFDVPSAPQIFGQLVVESGIEGILYTSKFLGKDCLAVFPQNFDEGSFIQLDDKAPAETKIIRLDFKTWGEIQE